MFEKKLLETTQNSNEILLDHMTKDEIKFLEPLVVEEFGMEIDPHEPRYCLCNQVSFGQMIACDNQQCNTEWFHFSCVKLTEAPKGKWYCPECSEKKKQ